MYETCMYETCMYETWVSESWVYIKRESQALKNIFSREPFARWCMCIGVAESTAVRECSVAYRAPVAAARPQ